MKLRDDIQAAKDRIKLRLGYGSELKSLADVLVPGETVERMLFGKLGDKRGLIVLTDRRLLFHYRLPQGIAPTTQIASYARPQITSIHATAKGLFAELTVTVASSVVTFAEVPRQYVDEFVVAANSSPTR